MISADSQELKITFVNCLRDALKLSQHVSLIESLKLTVMHRTQIFLNESHYLVGNNH